MLVNYCGWLAVSQPRQEQINDIMSRFNQRVATHVAFGKDPHQIDNSYQ